MWKKITEHTRSDKFILGIYGNVGDWFNKLLFLCYDILYFRQMF